MVTAAVTDNVFVTATEDVTTESTALATSDVTALATADVTTEIVISSTVDVTSVVTALATAEATIDVTTDVTATVTADVTDQITVQATVTHVATTEIATVTRTCAGPLQTFAALASGGDGYFAQDDDSTDSNNNPLIAFTSSLSSALGFTLSGTTLQVATGGNVGDVVAFQAGQGTLGTGVITPSGEIPTSVDDYQLADCAISGTTLSCKTGSYTAFLSCVNLGGPYLDLGVADYPAGLFGCDITSATVVPLCIVS